MELWPFLALMTAVSVAVRFAPFVPERYRLAASMLVLLAFLCWAPFALDGFRTFQMARVATWVIVAMGLNILTGYNGQISLGHGALVALGAYTAALLMDSGEQMGFIDSSPWPFWSAIIMAGIITAVAGFLLGIPALRLSGPYLAIATLALAISFPSILRKYDSFTGGGQGLSISQPPPPPFLDGLIDRNQWLFYLSLLIALVMLLLAWSMLRGPLGRALVAVRDSEVAASAMGINVARTKVAAFTISAFYAGVAGGVYTQVLGTVTPESIDILQSINFLTAIVIGGLASIMGSILGAAALIFLPSDAPDLVGNIPGLNSSVVERAPGAIQGAIVIFVILLMPYGVAGFLHRLARLRPASVREWFRGRPASLRAWAADLRQDLADTWESRPWNRERFRDSGREER